MTAAAGTAPAPDQPFGAFASVMNAAVGVATTKLDQRITSWTDKLNGIGSSEQLGDLADEGLDELAEGGGAKQTAGAEGVKAGLHGKNPFVAAVKGLWKGGSPAVKAAILTAIVSTILLLILSPVLLLVFLLSLLVIAAVHRARSTAK
jgi:hypothetical protein